MNAIDTETGAEAFGSHTGGESNIRAMIREMGLKPEEVYFCVRELSIRDFHNAEKGQPYAGCTQEELVSFTHKEWLKKGWGK